MMPRHMSDTTTRLAAMAVVFASVMMALGLMSVTSTTALSAETSAGVRLKTVEATSPAEVTIVKVGANGPVSEAKPAAPGERWLIVKAISEGGTYWGGFAVNRASVSDAAGKKYPVIGGSNGPSSTSGKLEFYPREGSFMGEFDTAFFLFSIPADSKGLKFGVGGVELPIPQVASGGHR